MRGVARSAERYMFVVFSLQYVRGELDVVRDGRVVEGREENERLHGARLVVVFVVIVLLLSLEECAAFAVDRHRQQRKR